MSYAGIQLFMEKLYHLIHSNHILQFVNNNPEIIYQRPQFQLLYDDLSSMIETLRFIHQHQDLNELEEVNDLKKRFADAVEEAQYIVDLFLSSVYIRNNGNFPTSADFNPSLNINDVRRSFRSVEVELMSINMERTLTQSPPAPDSISRNSQKKLFDEIVVGLDRDVEVIRDKLVEDKKKVDVVAIVGMGGIGKSTLANKVFNDRFVMGHFYVRVWVTVSQRYDKRDVLIQILVSMGVKLDIRKADIALLRELVHKHLFGRRYLIVIDDIWQKETWDNLKLFFPHGNNGSRILLTSRLTEVAKHANSEGLIHHIGYLNTIRSWELLYRKVFDGNEYPEWSIKPGMQIVENCHGLPLAVVIIARVLAKDAWSEKFWAEIAYKTSSYIVDVENGCLETLGLSYNHLPLYLRECFLYLGGFPEDYTFQVQRLIWLWVAEGFIQQAGSRSLEDIADGYLMDLIDRNLVIVADRRNSDGGIKACKLHDLVRVLCLKKAMEEGFILKIGRQVLSSHYSMATRPPYKPVRMFTNKDTNILDCAHTSTQNLRSILWFSNFTSLSGDIAKYIRSFVLLRVLDLHDCRLHDFPYSMKLLVHLRYLAIWNSSEDFPSSICNLWNLQTLIYFTDREGTVLPNSISNLVSLRHLRSYMSSTNEAVGIQSSETPFYFPFIEKPMNLQTVSGVVLGDGVDNFQKCFPCIKELTCITYSQKHFDFKPLTHLETLKLTGEYEIMKSTVHDSPKGEPSCGMNHITFPATLKILILVSCGLPWGDMSIIQSLPNLQVLQLQDNAFEGSWWKTDDEQEFKQLKFLRLESLNIKLWEADSISFPCLRRLEISNCKYLEEIPLEIGEIPTLEVIKIKECRHCVSDLVKIIEKEQQDSGNFNLKIDINMEIQF